VEYWQYMLILRNYKALLIWDSTLSDLWIFGKVCRSHHLLLRFMNELRKIWTSIAFCVYMSSNFRLVNFFEMNIKVILSVFTYDERFLWLLIINLHSITLTITSGSLEINKYAMIPINFQIFSLHKFFFRFTCQ
jgi:hypothetical protein